MPSSSSTHRFLSFHALTDKPLPSPLVPRPSCGTQSREVTIRGLPETVDDNALRAAFGEFGKITSSCIVRNQQVRFHTSG